MNITRQQNALLCGLIISLLSTMAGAETLTFNSGGNHLHGYYQAAATSPRGVILFVHGDGATPYDADGYYTPLWTFLNLHGFATFSWDKPGVGDSSGNWLEQSMEDRQQEVLDAIAALKQQFPGRHSATGLFGFSQAGWVAPAVANRSTDVDFLIGAGFAINWLHQSAFLTRSRLQKSGASEAQIQQALQQGQQANALLARGQSYREYLQTREANSNPVTAQRYRFIQRNHRADATASLKTLKKPTLILLGAEDSHVDIQHTQNTLTRLCGRCQHLQSIVLPNATHALLKHNEFGVLEPGLGFWLKLQWMEQDAFSNELFPQLTRWLDERPTAIAQPD